MSALLVYGGAIAVALALLVAYMTGLGDGRAINAALMASMKVDLDQANDRLYGAWKEGAQIPPRPVDLPPPEPALPALLQGLVDEWESPEGKRAAEAEIRAKLLRNMSPVAIFREHENSVGLT